MILCQRLNYRMGFGFSRSIIKNYIKNTKIKSKLNFSHLFINQSALALFRKSLNLKYCESQYSQTNSRLLLVSSINNSENTKIIDANSFKESNENREQNGLKSLRRCFVLTCCWICSYLQDKYKSYDEETHQNNTASNQLMQVSLDNAQIYIRKALALHKQAKYSQADQLYQLIIQAFPDDCLARSNYAASLIKQSRYDQANQQLQIATLLIQNSIVYNNYGTSLLKQKRYNEADDKFQKAIKISPNSQLFYYNYGTSLLQQQKYQQAEEQFKIALNINSKQAAIYINYGSSLLRQQRFKQAEKQYLKAIQINPNDPEAHYNYALTLKKQGKDQQAEIQFKIFQNMSKISEDSFNKI